VRNKDGSPFHGTLRLYTNAGQELARTTSAQSGFDIPVSSGTHWYFVRVQGTDGKSAAYLAPVWIEGR
jgi:hypothetical protein